MHRKRQTAPGLGNKPYVAAKKVSSRLLSRAVDREDCCFPSLVLRSHLFRQNKTSHKTESHFFHTSHFKVAVLKIPGLYYYYYYYTCCSTVVAHRLMLKKDRKVFRATGSGYITSCPGSLSLLTVASRDSPPRLESHSWALA